MKKYFSVVFLTLCSIIYAQIPNDLKFETNFVDAENHWVVVPTKTEKDINFAYGFLYFDESGGGYSLQEVNEFTFTDGKFVKAASKANEMNIVRLGNPNIQFALLSDSRIKELQLVKLPAFLKHYNSLKDDNEKKVLRASAINALNRSDLALPILEGVKDRDYSSQKLFFEMAYAYNALKNYSNAEVIINEAEKKGYLDELLIKEKIYSLSHNNKLEEADRFLLKNISEFKSSLYKEESIGNMVGNYYNSKNIPKVKEWLSVYYKHFPEGGRYKNDMGKLKAEIDKTFP